MNPRLKNRFVIITGASSGLGEALAYKVAESGGNLLLLARRKERLARISKEINEKYHVSSSYYELDVRNLKEVEETFQIITKEYERIDVLVNNAGFGIFQSVEDASLSEMHAMFEVNVYGLIACTKMVLPKMRQQKEGHIINIASQAGKMATPKSSFYSSTKHAVIGFTNSLRMEVMDQSIFVTAVNPGPIRTNFFEQADTSGKYVKNIDRWMLRPEDVAKKIVRAMLTNKREINLPWWMESASRLYRLAPALFEKVARKAFFQK
ncbi:SDR family NAD(P)-dependent oxidoreductase [Bacillus alveayuensis]|uniref:SDR family NAD(P)-dependent oxidoreductase n=1 Tax=Aeribacillus alveayuensis TaxID=279215 RepID=UPI0005D133DF|nr:SDR family oxidoreductase [Bacillus alveayuensis]